MTVDSWIHDQTAALKSAGIATARLDCLVLLEDVLNTNRTQILAHPEQKLTGVELGLLNKMVDKRALHIPLAYIRNKTEFYGREFYVNEHVLEPRPESESIIEILKVLSSAPAEIIDIGTGSGALAITAKLELPTARVFATDIDLKCLQVAERNAKNLNAEIQFLCGNLLDPFKHVKLSHDVALLCNLPYVPDNFQINTAATHEPRHALFGGPDGLDLYRSLFDSPAFRTIKPAYVIAESLPPQHELLATIAHDHGYQLQTTEDFIQLYTPLA